MWRVIGLALGVALISFPAAAADEPQKSVDAKKPDGYFKITFEAKGHLTVVLDREKKTVIGVHLEGAIKDTFPFLRPIPLADDKKLHDAARELDGQLVVVTGIGEPYVYFGTGSRNHEEGVRLVITGIQAAKEKK